MCIGVNHFIMFCSGCGGQHDEGQRFCGNCGARLDDLSKIDCLDFNEKDEKTIIKHQWKTEFPVTGETGSTNPILKMEIPKIFWDYKCRFQMSIINWDWDSNYGFQITILNWVYGINFGLLTKITNWYCDFKLRLQINFEISNWD